ncbi:MAG: tetratricopeptide repeat protein [Bacteroidetes bacterium]|nr:tetratricopeptide repeat protein [Bacteroidota bacterium]
MSQTPLQIRISLSVLLLLFMISPPLQGESEGPFVQQLNAARESMRQNADSAVVLARRALRMADNDEDRANAREMYAQALWQTGDFTAAQVEYGILLGYAVEQGDAQLRGRVLNGIGGIERLFENYDLSITHHAEAYRLFDSLGNQLGAAQAMHDLGVTLHVMDRGEEAMEIHRRALELRKEEGNKPGIAESHNSIGTLYRHAGNIDSALYHYREALALRKQFGVLSLDVAATVNNIGNVYRSAGDPARALEFYRESLNISRSLGSDGMIAVTLKNMGAAFGLLRDFPSAREVLDEALSLAKRIRFGRVLTEALEERSRIEESAGRPIEALAYLRQLQSARDSLSRMVNDARLRQAETRLSEIKEKLELEKAGERGGDFLVFLIVIIALLIVIVVIALSALRMRGRGNRALSEKNAEIRKINAELQRLNADLARSEEKYRLLFERLPVGVFLYDGNLRMLQVNNAFADIIGSPRTALEDFDLSMLRDRRILPALQAAFNGNGGAYEGEYRALTNENILQISLRTAPVQYRDMPLACGIGFVLDISNWKRVEADLIESREIAVHADRLKNAFLTNISHEIRTPLNIIMGYFGILHQDLRERISEEEEEYFRKVEFAVRRLLRTVDQILSLSILESGSYTINPEQCTLHQLVKELYEEIAPLASDKGVAVHFESTCREAYIYIDKYSVSQALRNLLDNAVKFTDEGVIDLALDCNDSFLSFILRDTGIGMSEEYVRRLYDAFSQEDDGYARSYEGLGLGLRLTKRYLDVNKGSIQVESRKGEGTTFTVTFPVTHHFPRSEDTAPEQESPTVTLDRRYTLLIVEDDHETQKFLQLILAGSFDLYFSESAEDAWRELHQNQVDLVLMDISLRGDEDGLQLTGRIREHPQFRDLPIIAVTAHAFADDRRRSLEAGCNEYLPKPFRVHQLRELVARFLH